MLGRRDEAITCTPTLGTLGPLVPFSQGNPQGKLLEESVKVSMVDILESLVQATLSLICEPGTGDSLWQGAKPTSTTNRQAPLPFLSEYTAPVRDPQCKANQHSSTEPVLSSEAVMELRNSDPPHNN